MKNPEQIELNEDTISIKKDSVTFNDLTIINKDLASYLEESDDRVETLINILDVGVKTLNSLKNSNPIPTVWDPWPGNNNALI